MAVSKSKDVKSKGNNEKASKSEVAAEQTNKSESAGTKTESDKLLASENITSEFIEQFKTMKAQLDKLTSENIELSKKSKEDIEEDSLIEDYLEVPAVFFAFTYKYSVYSYKRMNKEMLPPNGGIRFKTMLRYNKKNSSNRGVETISISQAVCRSKKEAEYLRRSPEYNIKFFENINDAKSVDVSLAEKMSEANSRISSMNDYQVIERAKAEGINMSDDILYLRKELVSRMAKVALTADKKRKTQTIKELAQTTPEARTLANAENTDTY